MNQKLLKKEVLPALIEELRKKFLVVGPVNQAKKYRPYLTAYQFLENGDELIFEQPLYPAKDFFFPHKEELFEFSGGKIKRTGKTRKQTVFFMPKCDANAVHVLDKLLLEYPIDNEYRDRRENTFIVEIPCKEKETCFCLDLGFQDFADVKIINTKEGFVLAAKTKKGQELLKYKAVQKHTTECKQKTFTEQIKCMKKLDAKKLKDLMKYFESEIWKKEAEKCLSCTACNIVCPTCTCFNITDDVLLSNTKTGRRSREWAYCQLQNFTEVAGGHIFRKERDARLKHRIYHKLNYFKQQHGIQMCTGCGRCIAACPTGIDMTKIIKSLK